MKSNSQSHSVTLAQSIPSVYIIAYQESTTQLEATLTAAGFETTVLRQTPTPDHQHYSPSYCCLLNHYNAWQTIAQADAPSMIIEADFVPVHTLGHKPLPAPVYDAQTGISWLYTCASQLYTVTDSGYAEGFSVSTVAYILTPQAAQALTDFITPYAATPEKYSSWDSHLAEFLRKQGFKNYIPFRNYGEHGGRPNPEHRNHGLSAVHRADILYDRLAFRPAYARHFLQLGFERSRARLKGILRLLFGRYLRPQITRTSSIPWRLLTFAIARHLFRATPSFLSVATANAYTEEKPSFLRNS